MEFLELKLVEYLDSDDSSSSSDDDTFNIVAEIALAPQVDLGPRINLEDLLPLECKQLFRFEKDDLPRLYSALGIPDDYRCEQGTYTTGMEALMILLRRLAYPNRLNDLTTIFGRRKSELSMIFNMILDDIHLRFGDLLTSFDLTWLDKPQFASVIQEKGAPLSTCIGFLDGTVRPIPRPDINQQIMFSGHKRVHCIKFQSVTTPNGLIAHLFGPIEGRRHDAFILKESGLLEKLRPLVHPNGQPYVVYGDPAYGITQNVISPFRGLNLTSSENEFNKIMSSLRISVEWSFGKLIQQFAFLDFKKNLKLLLQPVGKYYIVGTLLINCHTCLYGSQVSSYFNLCPPSLEAYLTNQ